MKQILLICAVVALVGCGSPQGINQTSKAQIGTPIWEFETGNPVISSPAIGSDGTVYVGSYDKKLYAINGKSGVKLWEFETGHDVQSSPAIGSDGTVYVGSENKKLYAIKTDSKGLAKSPWPMRGQNARHTGRAK
jgi:outer membrane protein assembly factor BamB